MPDPAAVKRAVRGVLMASTGPLTPAELAALLKGFGHAGVTVLDVKLALAGLAAAGEVELTKKDSTFPEQESVV